MRGKTKTAVPQVRNSRFLLDGIGVLCHPTQKVVLGDHHPGAHMQGRKICPMHQSIGPRPRDPQEILQFVRTQNTGQLIKVFEHSAFSFFSSGVAVWVLACPYSRLFSCQCALRVFPYHRSFGPSRKSPHLPTDMRYGFVPPFLKKFLGAWNTLYLPMQMRLGFESNYFENFSSDPKTLYLPMDMRIGFEPYFLKIFRVTRRFPTYQCR